MSPTPRMCSICRIETAREMLDACMAALPADIAVCAAAVADWRVREAAGEKLKKENGGLPALELAENPDILHRLAGLENRRPPLVVGFAAETGNVVAHAREKRRRKGCDWILANDVSPGTGVFGGERNTIHLIDEEDRVEDWPPASKTEVADRLALRIADRFAAGA